MILLLAYLFLALFVSFMCSIMESVLLSTPQSFLMVEADKGSKWAEGFMNLKSEIDRPLSAILSLNTVAHTIGAAGVGAQAVKVFGEAYFGVVSVVLTILILVITEIIPKTMGARFWRRLAKTSYHVINGTIFITYPLVLLTVLITKLFAKSEHEQTTSREELAALASIGADEGIFTEKEGIIIQNLLKLKNVKVKEIMTPRVVVAAANENLSLTEFMKSKNYLKFSRIPIYDKKPENITGYVIRQTVFEKIAEGNKSLNLRDVKREIIAASSDTVLFEMWEKMLEAKEHIAMVVGPYGGLDGIVTMEDIIETLLGLEILDEKDTVSDMQNYARERWKERQAKYNFLDLFKSDGDIVQEEE